MSDQHTPSPTLRQFISRRFPQSTSQDVPAERRDFFEALDRYVGRPATLDDLSVEFIHGVVLDALNAGQKPDVGNHHRGRLIIAWRCAHQMGIRDSAPPADLPPFSPLQQFLQSLQPQPHRDIVARMQKSIQRMHATLRRPPRPEDLTTAHVAQVLDWMQQQRYAPDSISRTKTALLQLGQAAADAGLVRTVPTAERLVNPRSLQNLRAPASAVWTADELARLMLSARTMPGTVAGIDAAVWWPAFVLTVLQTDTPARPLLTVDAADLDETGALLTIDGQPHALHPLTADALAELRRHTSDSKLFPFGRDKSNIFAKYKRVLQRAGLDDSRISSFDRLRSTGLKHPGILDRLDLSIQFTPQPTRSRNRKSRANTVFVSPRYIPLAPLDETRTVRHFFRHEYVPCCLPQADDNSTEGYETAIRRLTDFTGRDVILDELTESMLKKLRAWAITALGKRTTTANNYVGRLWTLWKYAADEGFVARAPRRIRKLPTPKRLPTAWSLSEVDRLMRAAAETPGDVAGIPAGQWWPMLLWTLYETGIRINAAMQLRTSSLDVDSGILRVPAEFQKQRTEQSFDLHPETLARIRATNPASRERLFPWRIQTWENDLRDHYREILERAGLPTESADMFHKMRRTTATIIADNFGIARACQMLGHSTETITKRYIDPTKLSSHNLAKLMPRPGAGPQGGH